MNILYIEHYAGSPDMGMEFRPYYLAREWVKSGHRVTIIAGDYSHLRKNNPIVDGDFKKEIIDGIEYIWIKTGQYSGNGLKRALTMERFVRKLFVHARKIALRWKPDIVIASSTYPLDTYAAQRIAKYAHAKYIHEVHDMWPSTLYEVGGMSKLNPFVVIMQFAENSAYRKCDECVALLPYAKKYMVKHGLNPRKFNNIQNGVVEDEWRNPESLPNEHVEFFEAHKDDFIVGYFGGHAISNALDWELDIAKEMKNQKGIIFVFVGDGVEKEKLIKKALDENINNAYFLSSVPKKSIPNLLKEFDCSYMTGMPSPLYRFGLCLNKMYDSMMAGIPIICAFDAPDTLVKVFKCGYQYSPENKSAIIESINELYNMPLAERNIMGERGKKAIIEQFTYKKLAYKFEKIMERN